MSLSQLLDLWQNEPAIAANVTAWQTWPARPAQTVPWPSDLAPALRQALQGMGITSLYTHQAAAWQCVQQGQNPVIVTSTASGKTLCYNLPVLHRLLGEPGARALYLFPTKALAQDQHSALQTLLARQPKPGIQVSTYDGDTPAQDRPIIRRHARLVISNPDMLHTGILPHHAAWADFLAHLRLVVIDEMHICRGVFGSHVANVLRRLKRLAHFYGAFPQFILTSATIANPAELAERLIEEPVTVIDQDGSPRGERHFVVYNPPIIDRELGLRQSMLLESVRLAQDLLAANVQTIVFARTRHTVELLLTYLRGRFSSWGEEQIRGYRSGYLPRHRREIEGGLRSGAVRGVVATTALELGIDIGGMGAAVLAGYPGTIAGAWQQAGRAGRRESAALAVLVASAGPLDQFLAHHPDYFFARSPEHALINPDNLLILLGHLRCAAFELPFRAGEGFGRLPADQVAEFLEVLSQSGVLHRSGDAFFWMADQYPAADLSLRSASPDQVVLQTRDESGARTVGQVDQASAAWMVHPGAIYLHEGQTYLVESLDLEARLAALRPAEVDYYTQPRCETTVQLVQKQAQTAAAAATRAHGQVLVTNQLVGFRKIRWLTHEQLGLEDLTLPPTKLLTTGYWLTLNDETVAQLRDQGLWRGDPNDYGPDWPAQRERARQRDGYHCQVCGAAEQESQHHVHHKIPFRCFDSPVQANRLSNLVTLCPACHRRVELNVRVRSGLGGLAFVLGNLAPLLLMCDARDMGVHADPQSPLGEGRPTVLIYDLAPAGLGLSERLDELHDQLMQHALELTLACPCADGCPSCVGPGGPDGQGSKHETLALLRTLSRGQS